MKLNRRELFKTLGGAALIGGALRPKRAFGECLGIGYTEVFPTSPLILNPFADELPIPAPAAKVPQSEWSTWPTPPEPWTGGQQDSELWTHQIGCTDLGLPYPEYYRFAVRWGEHSFTSSLVKPMDAGGNFLPALPVGAPDILDSQGRAYLPASVITGFASGDGPAIFPGPMIYARYGQPACVRFVNELDQKPLELDSGDFGAPDYSFLTHLHNGHTACESDGNPNHRPTNYMPGMWSDNLYLNWPAGGDDKEKQSFMWFHDHRLHHTGANVFKGMVGLYPIYDPDNNKDNGDERKGYRLPGVPNAGTGRIDYDIPLALYDCRLDDGVVIHNDFHDCEYPLAGNPKTHPEWWGKSFFRHFPNHGFVGDIFTVNGKAYPVLRVKRRRYRLRFLDASIARVYELKLMTSLNGPVAANTTGRTGDKLQGQYQLPDGQQCMKMVQIAAEGGLLQFPFLRNSIVVWPAKRREVIVDFSKYMDGSPTCSAGREEVIYLVNVTQMTTGRKPNDGITNDVNENPIPDPDYDPDFRVPVLKIIIEPGTVVDNSKDPLVYANGDCSLALDPLTKLPLLTMRAQPNMPRSFKGVTTRSFELQRSGTFGDETEWVINGQQFTPDVNLATPLKGAAEIWEVSTAGGWGHPMHFHQEEHRVLWRRKNGITTVTPTNAKDPTLYNKTYNGHDHPDDVGREDVIALYPGETVAMWRQFRTFVGHYVAHCHNLAHEDHNMMFGWKIL